MHTAVKNYTLNNNIEIPAIGFGTWQTPDGETAVQAVKSALEAGYLHIDTAAVYGNEKSIGTAIAESKVPRESLFLTSKLWNTERGFESTLKAFDRTLRDLQTDYLDLYLIHWPANARQFNNWEEINAETWRALEQLYKTGKVKAIGLSNFLPHHLEAILKTAEIIPVINQVEFHPGMLQQETAALCKKHNILIEAWSPLGTGKMLTNEILGKIAARYDKSVAQLCIRWCLQHGVLPLPKSITPTRISHNLEVYDFEITQEDMAVIDGMPYIGGSGLNPDKVDF